MTQELLEDESTESIEKLKTKYETLKKNHGILHEQLRTLEKELDTMDSHPPNEFDAKWVDRRMALFNKIIEIRNEIQLSFQNLQRLQGVIPELQKKIEQAKEAETLRKREIWQRVVEEQAKKRTFEEMQKAQEANLKQRQERRQKAERTKILDALATIEKKERKSQ
jgi:hypothetical protein